MLGLKNRHKQPTRNLDNKSKIPLGACHSVTCFGGPLREERYPRRRRSGICTQHGSPPRTIARMMNGTAKAWPRSWCQHDDEKRKPTRLLMNHDGEDTLVTVTKTGVAGSAISLYDALGPIVTLLRSSPPGDRAPHDKLHWEATASQTPLFIDNVPAIGLMLHTWDFRTLKLRKQTTCATTNSRTSDCSRSTPRHGRVTN